MKKYRLRKQNGQVLKEFEESEFKNLIKNKSILGHEEFQEYPDGEWCAISHFPELESILVSFDSDRGEDTLIKNLNEISGLDSRDSGEEQSSKPAAPKEFKFELNDPFEGKSFAESEVATNEDNEVELPGEDVEKTLVRKITVDNESNLEKTVLNQDFQKQLQEEKDREAREKEELLIEEFENKVAPKEEEIEVVPDYENEATQVLSVAEINEKIIAAGKLEKELDEGRKDREQENSNRGEVVGDEKKRVGPSRRKKIIVAFIVLLALFLLLEDEEQSGPKQITYKAPKIYFPTLSSTLDNKRSKELYGRALELESTPTYINKLKAIKLYFESLKHNFYDNPSAARLIFLYSDVLENSKQYYVDAKKVYALIQNFEDKIFKDPEYAASAAYFYHKIGKNNAAINIMDKYSAIEGNKRTPLLFAVYLRVLSERGNLVKAEEVAKSLDTQDKKSLFSLESLYRFHKDKEDYTRAISFLKEATQKHPNSVYFLLERGEIFLRNDELDQVKKVLQRVNLLNAESSRKYYANYLKLKGFYFARQKDFSNAIKNLNKSVEVFEDKTLTLRLAEGELTDDEEINNLFKDSKTKVLVERAKEFLRKDNLNEAFKIANEALEIKPNHIDARLTLADIQIKKGYYDDALRQVKALFDEHRDNLNVNYKLIDIYIDMYKFREANQQLELITIRNEERYATAKSKFYTKKEDYNLAAGWLGKAISLNRLNEDNIFQLALFYMKFHRYRRAKSTLNRAIDLDPFNIKYRIFYAKILYEEENATSAIGYLYDVLKDFPDNIGILSEIGIYYYKSGQIKNYKKVKEQILSLPGDSTKINNFLLESAKVDNNFREIIKKSRTVIENDPGALEVRLNLAEILIEYKKFKEAKKQLDEIKSRFSSYPRLNYFYAKLYLYIDDIEGAIKLAKAEMKENPNVVDGPLLLGKIYMRKKDLLEAKKYFLRAAQINRKNTDAILGLAGVAFYGDQYDMALDQYQKAAALEPGRADIYRLLGDTYRKIGQGQLAIKNYKQFLELSPQSSYKSKINQYIRTME